MKQQQKEYQEEYGCIQKAHFGMKDTDPVKCDECNDNEATNHVIFHEKQAHFCQACVDKFITRKPKQPLLQLLAEDMKAVSMNENDTLRGRINFWIKQLECYMAQLDAQE